MLHESLNMAAVMALPILFVCENNLFSSHLDIHLRQPENRVSRYADAHDIPAKLVDGNDVIAVAEAAAELIARARRGEGPGFLEAVTYRWRGHVGPKEDVDVGVRRRPEELVAWKKRDPVRRLAEALSARNALDGGVEAITAAERKACETALAAARKAAYPAAENLLGLVYQDRAP